MKIGFLGESPADQAAMAIFTQGILGQPPEPISNIDLEARGVTGVFRALDGVYRGAYYNSDAEGLVVVMDCDDTELHNISRETGECVAEGCRYCKARNIITLAKKQLKGMKNRPDLKVTIGIAVPSIEAWYLCGNNHNVGEPAWSAGLASGRRPFARPQLKTLVYGTDRPSLELETERALKEARRISEDKKNPRKCFPYRIWFNGQRNSILDTLETLAWSHAYAAPTQRQYFFIPRRKHDSTSHGFLAFLEWLI